MKFKKIASTLTFGAVALAFAGPASISLAHAEDRQVTKQVAPDYPRGAERRGIEGHVVVEYKILAAGDVADIKVVESEPAGVFDEAVLNAVSDWKYAPGGADSVKQAKLSFTK